MDNVTFELSSGRSFTVSVEAAGRITTAHYNASNGLNPQTAIYIRDTKDVPQTIVLAHIVSWKVDRD